MSHHGGHGPPRVCLFETQRPSRRSRKLTPLVVDKTARLRKVSPSGNIVVFEESGVSRSNCFDLVASVERASEHPLAKAIVRAAEDEKLLTQPVEEFRATAGGGAKARSQANTCGRKREVFEGSRCSASSRREHGGLTVGTASVIRSLRSDRPAKAAGAFLLT